MKAVILNFEPKFFVREIIGKIQLSVKEKKISISNDPRDRTNISASEHCKTPLCCAGVATIGDDRPRNALGKRKLRKDE